MVLRPDLILSLIFSAHLFWPLTHDEAFELNGEIRYARIVKYCHNSFVRMGKVNKSWWEYYIRI
jgi:hypothetical protein